MIKLQSLKKKRSTIRASTSKLLNRIDAALTNDEDIENLEVLFEQLVEKSDSLKTLNLEVENETDLDNLESEVEASQEYTENIIHWRCKLSKRIKTLSSKVSKPDLEENQNSTQNTEVLENKNIIGTKTVKLPRLEIPKFFGNPSHFLEFYSQFENAIDKNPNLSKIDKLSYLRGCLFGDAAAAISGLTLTDENYDAAIEILKERFGRKNILINCHFSQLLNIKPVKNSSDLHSLRKLYQKVEIQVRNLNSLGIESESYGNLLCPIILKLLPPDLGLQISKDSPDESFDLDHLLILLRKDIANKERAESIYQENKKVPPLVTPPQKHETVIKKKNERVKPRFPSLNQTSTQQFSVPVEETNEKCIFCLDKHKSELCESLSIDEKKNVLRKQFRCILCLKVGHRIKDCVDVIKCVCGGRHSRALCYQNANKKNEKKEKEQTEIVASVSQFEDRNKAGNKSFYLQVCSALIRNKKQFEPVKVLLDSGSMRSFLSLDLQKRFKFPVIRKESLSVFSFGAKTPLKKTFDVVEIKIENRENPCLNITIEALVIEQISAAEVPIPDINIWKSHKMLKGLQISNCYANESNKIGILIGIDYYNEIVTGNVKRLDNKIVAIETLLGWCLQGSGSSDSVSNSSMTFNVILGEDVISDQIKRFWELESLGIDHMNESTDPMENDVMKTFLSEIKFENSRYKVRLPWKTDMKYKLGDNKKVAEERFLRLKRRFKNDPKLFASYQLVLKDYLDQNIIEIAPDVCDNKEQISFYLPHRAVVREDRISSKLRIVFDASSHSPGELSLNNCLHVGPNLYPDIFELLLSFRLHPVAFTADIRQAFLQIEVDVRDRDISRFFFTDNPFDDSLPLKTYRFARILFGLNSSPFMLAATIKHHLKNYESIHPDTCRFLNNSVYVDDVIGGHQDPEHALETSLECIRIFKDASMILHKWQTNSSELLDLWKEKGIVSEDTSEIFGAANLPFKVLGVAWDNVEDQLYFDIHNLVTFLSNPICTKRFLLQAIGRIFDPVGFLGPFTIRVKVLIQEVWKLSLDWDDQLPTNLSLLWKEWCSEISSLSEFRIQRCYFSLPPNHIRNIELHCFSDSSLKAYGTVAYLRVTSIDDQIFTIFVSSKARVAPLTSITLPRLELMGALLSAKLSKRIADALKLEVSFRFWTDSKITYFWVKGLADNFKPFVKNRVTEIQKLTSPACWYYCPGKTNPADLISRGAKVSELKLNPLWLQGPEWLKMSPEFWPEQEECKEIDLDKMEYRKKFYNAHQLSAVIDETIIDVSRYSRLKKLMRVTAWINRFIRKATKTSIANGPLSSEELEEAEKLLIKLEQKKYFIEETESLKKNKNIEKKSSLLSLNPFLDSRLILRIGGRLKHSDDLTEGEKHPIILPAKSWLTKLMIEAEHEKIMHGGTAATLASIRNRFWIPKGRQVTKKVIKKCLICKMYSAKPADQITSQMPADRINQTPPFFVCGIDFAGPVYVKNNGDTQKSYIALFTCATTRALHLELVPNLTADSFLMAFKRFIARRGNCRVIYSDNAKTFKKSKRELEALSKFLSHDVFRNFISAEGIQWKFIIERGPWWGGFYERLVKSVKDCVRKVLGRALLTYEEFTTVLTQVEAVLNCRPLTYVYNEHDEPSPLTPTQFLNFGHSNPAFPINFAELISEGSNKSSLSRRKNYQNLLVKQLWTKWKKLYLMDLRTVHRLKNPNPCDNLKVGDIVLIEGDSKHKLLWKCGRIIQVFPGRDGKVRSCELKTADGTLKRPVQLLYPLEL